MDTCIFCFQTSDNPKVFCLDNPGDGCTYGMHHEYPGEVFGKTKLPPKVTFKKVDKQVCLKCGVHSKNPVGATNGCEHEYPT